MRVLLDTHLLIWTASVSSNLSNKAVALIANPETELLFSVLSLWEIAIKRALNRPDFDVDPRLLRRASLDNGYSELPFLADHALTVSTLPTIHRDPFDRGLIAQARSEALTLITSDDVIVQYGDGIQRV